MRRDFVGIVKRLVALGVDQRIVRRHCRRMVVHKVFLDMRRLVKRLRSPYGVFIDMTGGHLRQLRYSGRILMGRYQTIGDRDGRRRRQGGRVRLSKYRGSGHKESAQQQ